jgi:co-chaperonin GroES (HSP10)
MYHEEVLTPVLFVVKMGPDCYKDEKRFPSGPSCKKGDFVVVRPNSGTRLKIHGREFRLINDDSVEAVVEDPRGITRAS